MIPNLCFCHHGNLCKSQGSACQVAPKVQPQGRWGRERSFWHFYLATCTVRQRTSYFQHFYSCNSEAVDSFVQGKTGVSICSEGLQGAEPSCECPARTVFTLITTEERVGAGEVGHKDPFHNLALARVPFRVTIPHFAKFASTVPSARVYLRTATPKGKEPFPSSLEATAGLDQFLQAFSQEVTQLVGSNPKSSTWKAQQQAQEAEFTSALQKSEAPLGCSSQLCTPPASRDSMSRVKREGREGRHSLGIPGSQAEKNNSTFWLVWTLGTSASIDLLDSLNRGMKVPVRGENTKGGCSEAVEPLPSEIFNNGQDKARSNLI